MPLVQENEPAVEAACRAAFVPPISDDRREDMRNALAAAYPLLVAERDRYQEEAESARAEAVELRAAIIEHRKRHPRLTSNADTRLWWTAGL